MNRNVLKIKIYNQVENRIVTTQTNIKDKVFFTRSTDFLPATQSPREAISFRSGNSERAERNDYQMTIIIVTNNFKNEALGLRKSN